MQLANPFYKYRVRTRDVLDSLPLYGVSREANEIHGVTGFERIADLTHRLEAADSRPLAGAGVDDHNWALAVIDLDAFRWKDPEQRVINRMRQRIAAHD